MDKKPKGIDNADKKNVRTIFLSGQKGIYHQVEFCLKIFDIRFREVGAKRPLNGTSKVNGQTNRQTHRQMDKSTYRKHRPRGPML